MYILPCFAVFQKYFLMRYDNLAIRNFKNLFQLYKKIFQNFFLPSNKVTALCYASAERLLLSGGEDGVIVCWNMAANRKETATWVESDICQVYFNFTQFKLSALQYSNVNEI